jgi:hypothetical protein
MIALLLTLQLTANAASVTDAPTFSLQLVDGTIADGAIIAWQNEKITLSLDGEVRELALEQIARLSQTTVTSTEPAGVDSSDVFVRIGLRDHSALRVAEFRLGQEPASGDGDGDGDEMCSMTWQGSEISLPNESIRYVRFREATESLAKQWQELLDAKHEGDVIVIRRSGKSLDYLEGVIRGITPVEVRFKFEDETIDVDAEKLEGAILFAANRPSSRRSPRMQLFFSNDDILQTNRADLHGDNLRVETESGAIVTVGLDALQRIDFTTGRVVYLSDLPTSSVKITPAIGSRVNAESMNQLLYAPRRDISFSGSVLTLAVPSESVVRAYTKGMAIHSKTELNYRLRGEFERLKAVVGLEPHRSRSGSVRLVISLDGATAFDETIDRSQEPLELDMEIVDVNKLTILVNYGNDGDAGDRLHLCDLRVIK